MVINHYQPITNLQTGRVLGVEVLGRLSDGANLVSPAVFLPSLDADALEELLFVSLPKGLAALAACHDTHPDLFMAFNVSPRIMLRSGFVDRLLRVLSCQRISPGRITLEILEDDEFLSLPAARTRLDELHAAGIRMALDDVGTGYSSLNRLRELAVDKIKLDQAFVRELQGKPESLHFVAAMLSLARGLHTMLVVEGVETEQIMNALKVMGIEGAQGYAIARPMPQAALVEWLTHRAPTRAAREPSSLLGAYAAHLSIVEACRALMNQPLKFVWSDEVRNPHACAIGCYFDAHGLHETPYGMAHKRFHQLIDRYDEDPEAWEAATAELWRSLQEAIRAEGADALACTAARLVRGMEGRSAERSGTATPRPAARAARGFAVRPCCTAR